jgi:hypothetical protein
VDNKPTLPDDVLEFIDLVLKHYPAWSNVFAKGVALEKKYVREV